MDCYEKNKSNALEEYLLQEVTSHKVYTNSLSIFNLNVVKCNDMYYNCDNKEDIPDYIRWGALIYTRDFKKIPDIAKDILTKEEVEKIMDKLEKLQEDSLFMSQLEAMEWQQWEDKSIQTEIRKEGFADGLANGIKQGIGLTIKNMNKNNIPIETISKVTNKTIKEIKNILKEK